MIEALLLALALAMDAFAVALTQGARFRPGVREALAIALTFGVFQGVMPLIGWGIGAYALVYVEAVDHWIAFGLLASTLVILTGGLEAGIAAHIINNVGAYTLAGFTASIAELRAVRSLGWSDALLDVAGFALFAVVAVLLARRLRLPVTTPATPTGSGGLR